MEHYRDVQAVIEFLMTWGIAGIVAIVAISIAAITYSELA
jgi:hypothetical protein